MKLLFLVILSALSAAPLLAETVLATCQFDKACGSNGACNPYELSMDVIRDDNYALWLRGPDVSVRVQRLTSGPLSILSGTGYEPADTGEDGGFTSLVMHENGEAVILSAVALPLGDGALESGQFLGKCLDHEIK